MEQNKAATPGEAKKTSLLKLYAAFFRIGAFTFGGGYAMLPMLEKECVEKSGWTTREELLDYFAIGQCTPGVIAVNTATFVGYSERGLLGSALATLGVITPSLIIITIIAALLANFADYKIVQDAFAGIRVAVCVLIVNAVIRLIRQNVKNILGVLLLIIGFIIVGILGLSPIYVVVGAGLAGIAMYYFAKKEKGELKK